MTLPHKIEPPSPGVKVSAHTAVARAGQRKFLWDSEEQRKKNKSAEAKTTGDSFHRFTDGHRQDD